ncbi:MULTISPECIES: hypothetical protein [Agrobacterium tumefaciens complex]|jgi:hypothetical protein|uniref:hypothetical protein n=1 Tax=Agrobacterium tumefaciens TaxID=358 RepID=UPI000FE28328|nr:hypothetical protein [Agrobacterium tumefaciens]QAB00911.1 hypothetical protein DC439_24170 [Agrobacterium tumefaciens]
MSQVVSFPSRHQVQLLDRDPNALSNTTEHAALFQLLERERDNLIKTTNFLEALYAKLGRHAHDGVHLSVAEDGPSATPVHMA